MTSTVSSKYQIVIPKALRKQLNIQPGQKVTVSLNADNQLVINTSLDALKQLQQEFSGRNIWGNDPTKTIRKLRDEWDD